MKKFLIILLSLSVLFTGCEKFVSQDDVDPNNPTSASLPTQLSVVEVAVYAVYTGQMARTSAILTQQIQGVQFQSQEAAKYQITENDIQNDWSTIYSSGIVNANGLIGDANAQGSPYYAGIGKVCKAMLLGIATDYWGDIPASEAGLGVANLTPKFEKQEDVLIYIQGLLDDAIADFRTDIKQNAKIPGSDDFIHGGVISNWKITAWILKARYANRLSDRSAGGSATSTLAAIDSAIASGMSSNANDANATFTIDANSTNPWAAFEQQRGGYIKMHGTLIEFMKSNNDPRISFYATLDNGGGYTGNAVGDFDTDTTSGIGTFYASATSPLPLVTYVEARFIEAEAANRAGNVGRAQTAFTEALNSNFAKFTGINNGDVTAYVATRGTLPVDANDRLKRIMEDKWVAMFTQPEVFSDWRRTGFPSLTPAPGANQPTIPVRFPTEQNERLYNPNAIVVSDLVTKVWWDVN